MQGADELRGFVGDKDYFAGVRVKVVEILSLIYLNRGVGIIQRNQDAVEVAVESKVGVSKNNVADYLIYMELAGLLGQLRDATGGIRGIGKVEKVYIDNPSLMTVLSGGAPNPGNLRETFFYNQMRVRNDVISSKDSDFVIDKYTFEIGGRKKGNKQIENIPDGFLVKDDTEYGYQNVIPLWHFGLNY